MRTLALALLFLAAAPAAAGTPAERTFDVPGRGQLVLAVPEGWQVETRAEEGRPWRRITLRPRAGDAFSVQLTPAFDPDDRLVSDVPPDLVRSIAQESLQKLAPQSVEKDLALEKLGGPLTGWRFTATDAAPGPGEWTHVTAGVAALGPFALAFTILTSGEDTPERAQALETIRGARWVPPPRPRLDPLALRSGSRGWTLQLFLPGFRSGPLERAGDGGVRVFAADEKSRVVASVSLSPAEGPDSASAACEHYLALRKDVPYAPSSLKRGPRAGLATVEYLIAEYDGVPVRQKNVFACLSRDGVWMEIHLSKVSYQPEDEALFDRILKTVRVAADGGKGE
jgi:hypothetical protein